MMRNAVSFGQDRNPGKGLSRKAAARPQGKSSHLA
jgi:hypothetical protein